MIKNALINESIIKTEIVIPKQKEQTQESIDALYFNKVKPNMHIYEWNMETNLVAPAEILNTGLKKIKIKRKAKCMYTPALNAENAYRKLTKLADKIEKMVKENGN